MKKPACLVVLALIVAVVTPSRSQSIVDFEQQLGGAPTESGQSPEKPAPTKVQPPTQGFDVPNPTIITQPNFKSSSKYGITTETDGSPLTDHKIFSVDTRFFIKKVRAGVAKQGANPDLEILLKELEKANFSYDQAEGTIHYEESTTFGNPVRLEDNPHPRGRELRDQMKGAITTMAEVRQKISSHYGAYLSAGRLPEEK